MANEKAILIKVIHQRLDKEAKELELEMNEIKTKYLSQKRKAQADTSFIT